MSEILLWLRSAGLDRLRWRPPRWWRALGSVTIPQHMTVC